MAGWMATWGALVVLMVSAAVPTAAQVLTIDTMQWSYDDSLPRTTSLTVCTTEILTGSTVNLTVSNSEITDLGGTIGDSGDLCALFHSRGKLPPPAGPTTYTLTAVGGGFIQESSGSVSFALDGATMDCGDSQVLRFKLSDGTVEGATCQPSNVLNSTCYVVVDDSTADPICFSGLDQSSNVNVCVQSVAFETVTPADGTFTADALHYDVMSFNFTHDYQDVSLKELLILPGVSSSLDVVSCDGVNCNDATLQPAETRYDLCGVFTDTGNTVVQYSSASFQDVNLQVNTIDMTVDFHFKNVKSDGFYFAYSVDNTNGVIIEKDTLDCSQVVVDDICNGFFIKDSNLGYVAVSNQNDEESNKIVAPVS